MQIPGRTTLPALAVAGVGSLVAATIWTRALAHQSAGWLAVDAVAGVLGLALLPVMWRRPVTGALAATLLAVVSPAATPPASVGALHTAYRRRLPVAIAVAAAGVAAHAGQGWWRPAGGLSYGWWLALIAVVYAALVGWGTLLRAHRALVASLRERARRAEDEQARRVAEARVLERNQIAREMHDVLAHRLSLLATYAGALEYRPDSSPEQLARAAGVVRTGVHQALTELREVIGVLRDGEPDEDPRPQPGLADLPRLVAESRDAGMRVRLVDRVPGPAALPSLAGRTAYRVVQEALTNARRHAPGEPVDVTLSGRPGAALEIEVRNPLPSPPVPGTPGAGLAGLAERVNLAGGELGHEVTAAGEFRLFTRLPWPA